MMMAAARISGVVWQHLVPGKENPGGEEQKSYLNCFAVFADSATDSRVSSFEIPGTFPQRREWFSHSCGLSDFRPVTFSQIDR